MKWTQNPPCYWVEEHNEAFYCWGLAVKEGYLEKQDNILFHVDHHDDFECGAYFHDFTRPITDLEERRRITREVLGIADFIVPAIYEGLFCSFYTMKGLVPRAFGEMQRFVKRVGNNGLTVGNYIPFVHGQYRKEGREEYRFFAYHEGALSPTPEMGPVALDVDLDYFCWDDALRTAMPKRMEVTEEAYAEYCRDRYHPFRILPRRLFQVHEEDGHYYLCYVEPPVSEPEADEMRIRKRIARFFGWLEEQPWEPSLVTVCRSVRSGYLPGNRAEMVEHLFREGLEGMWK